MVAYCMSIKLAFNIDRFLSLPIKLSLCYRRRFETHIIYLDFEFIFRFFKSQFSEYWVSFSLKMILTIVLFTAFEFGQFTFTFAHFMSRKPKLPSGVIVFLNFSSCISFSLSLSFLLSPLGPPTLHRWCNVDILTIGAICGRRNCCKLVLGADTRGEQ